MIAVGIDGYAGGWVAVALRDDAFERVEMSRRLEEIFFAFPDAAAYGVDIPIGLPEAYPRAADVEARAFVAPLSSTVFPTPPRSVLEARDYAQANGRMHELAGHGISRQSFSLARRIFEVDPLAREYERVFEVHPEVSFRELAGRPLAPSKRSWSGFFLRRSLLRGAGVELPEDLPRAPLVDVLGAAVAAWSAARYARGEAVPLPARAKGRIGAIWR